MKRSEFIREWRDGLLLSVRDVAARAKLPESIVAAIETGQRDPSIEELESLARTLGLNAESLLDEEVSGKSKDTDVLRVLFKSAAGLTPTAETRLQMLDAARAALDLLELQADLKIRAPVLPVLSLVTKPKEPLFALGSRQAIEARKRLNLGKEPIASMRDLVTQLGIPILAAHLGQSGPDAFSVFAPGGRLAFVLNVDGKHENRLVRRFSLAHELAHGFSDKPSLGGTGFACLIDSQRELDIETRANAFAVRLLLTGEVDKLRESLLDASVFRRTMERWGIHFSALRLFAKNLMGLTEEKMPKSLNVETNAPLHIRDAEELEAERSTAKAVPLPRRGELARLVLGGHVQGRISKGRARELLRVDATVDLLAMAKALGVG